ncbi:MAG: Sensor kinase CckA [Chloroflexi bacterium]|nr:Sensor kinase CckA [Chloroflexota bacterium]
MALIISIRAITQSLNNSLQQSQALANSLKKEVEERKRAEHNLRISEKKYRGLFENSPLLLMEVDKVYNILAINHAMVESLGGDMESLIGENLADILPEDVFQARSKHFQIALSKNKTINFNDERAGRYFYNIYVPSPDQKTLQVISHDITDEVKARQELLEYQELLSEKVETKTEELRREMEERKQVQQKAMEAQKMADLGVLSTGIAHELNSPLQGILTTSDYLLAISARENVDAAVLESRLKTIKESVLRCTKIVRSLYNYAHPAPANLAPQYIHNIVEDTLVLIEHQFANYDKISINTEIDEDMPPFICDRDRIMQILINLLTNARDAMPDGGQITLQSRYHPEEGEFVIRVIDEGEGIPEDVLEHIFKPFFTTKEAGKGTGLGLYIVKGLVNNRDGRIKVDSSRGKGTVVTLTYPE